MDRIERILKRLIELVTGTRADILEVEMSKLHGEEKSRVREAWAEEKAKSYIAGAAVAAGMLLLNFLLNRWLPEAS